MTSTLHLTLHPGCPTLAVRGQSDSVSKQVQATGLGIQQGLGEPLRPLCAAVRAMRD